MSSLRYGTKTHNLPNPTTTRQNSPMRHLTVSILVTVTVLLGNAGVSLSADYQKGLDAANRGDFATALREWKPLAEQRNAVAQKDLSVMYAFGKGVPKDYVYAHMWGNLAAANGNELGGMLRDGYERKMTPADISAAKKLSGECVCKKYKGY